MADTYMESYKKYWKASVEQHRQRDFELPPGHWYQKIRRGVRGVVTANYRGGRILDVGCGNGWATEHLEGEKYGIDINPAVLRVASKRGIKTRVADLNKKIPLRSGMFDLVVSIETLEHVFNYKRAVSEIARVTKPKGTVIIAVPYHGLLKNIAVSAFAFDRHFLDDWHIRFFTRKSMTRELDRNGLKVVGYRRMGGVPLLENIMVFVCRKVA